MDMRNWKWRFAAGFILMVAAIAIGLIPSWLQAGIAAYGFGFLHGAGVEMRKRDAALGGNTDAA